MGSLTQNIDEIYHKLNKSRKEFFEVLDKKGLKFPDSVTPIDEWGTNRIISQYTGGELNEYMVEEVEHLGYNPNEILTGGNTISLRDGINMARLLEDNSILDFDKNTARNDNRIFTINGDVTWIDAIVGTDNIVNIGVSPNVDGSITYTLDEGHTWYNYSFNFGYVQGMYFEYSYQLQMLICLIRVANTFNLYGLPLTEYGFRNHVNLDKNFALSRITVTGASPSIVVAMSALRTEQTESFVVYFNGVYDNDYSSEESLKIKVIHMSVAHLQRATSEDKNYMSNGMRISLGVFPLFGYGKGFFLSRPYIVRYKGSKLNRNEEFLYIPHSSNPHYVDIFKISLNDESGEIDYEVIGVDVANTDLIYMASNPIRVDDSTIIAHSVNANKRMHLTHLLEPASENYIYSFAFAGDNGIYYKDSETEHIIGPDFNSNKRYDKNVIPVIGAHDKYIGYIDGVCEMVNTESGYTTYPLSYDWIKSEKSFAKYTTDFISGYGGNKVAISHIYRSSTSNMTTLYFSTDNGENYYPIETEDKALGCIFDDGVWYVLLHNGAIYYSTDNFATLVRGASFDEYSEGVVSLLTNTSKSINFIHVYFNDGVYHLGLFRKNNAGVFIENPCLSFTYESATEMQNTNTEFILSASESKIYDILVDNTGYQYTIEVMDTERSVSIAGSSITKVTEIYTTKDGVIVDDSAKTCFCFSNGVLINTNYITSEEKHYGIGGKAVDPYTGEYTYLNPKICESSRIPVLTINKPCSGVKLLNVNGELMYAYNLSLYNVKGTLINSGANFLNGNIVYRDMICTFNSTTSTLTALSVGGESISVEIPVTNPDRVKIVNLGNVLGITDHSNKIYLVGVDGGELSVFESEEMADYISIYDVTTCDGKYYFLFTITIEDESRFYIYGLTHQQILNGDFDALALKTTKFFDNTDMCFISSTENVMSAWIRGCGDYIAVHTDKLYRVDKYSVSQFDYGNMGNYAYFDSGDYSEPYLAIYVDEHIVGYSIDGHTLSPITNHLGSIIVNGTIYSINALDDNTTQLYSNRLSTYPLLDRHSETDRPDVAIAMIGSDTIGEKIMEFPNMIPIEDIYFGPDGFHIDPIDKHWSTYFCEPNSVHRNHIIKLVSR